MRDQQKARTRQAIVRAAGSLLERGGRPSLDEVAAEAQVSRATAYRYFPGLDALLSEAAVDLMVAGAEDVFGADAPDEPGERLLRVDAMFDRVCREREVPLRLMLARILERSATQQDGGEPLRQNRREPLIREALAPLDAILSPAARERLVHALTMVIGTESLIALKDVAGLGAEEAAAVRRWTIKALLAVTLAEAG